MNTIHVLGIAGSLRERSLNRFLLDAARTLAPRGMSIEPFDLAGIPLYNADLDADGRRPADVERFKRAITDADALLIATPEYNYGVPGVLKNAIDWASRPSFRSPLAGKPAAIMGASGGAIGTARAQEQLKLTLLATLAPVLPHPAVTVARAREKFNADGDLVDAATRDLLAGFLNEFAAWVRRVGVAREGRGADG
ncbi:MAG TPA: NAD(P)H-dependent oxidoreductase [Longimicrobiales bacterium]